MPGLVACVLRVWHNGWTTSARMQESVLRECFCVQFAAREPDCHLLDAVDEQFLCSDDIRHYVCCLPLWSIINCELSKFFPSFPWTAYMDRPQRLALPIPRPRQPEFVFIMLALRLAVISFVYHACKADVCTEASCSALTRFAVRRYNVCLPSSLRCTMRD